MGGRKSLLSPTCRQETKVRQLRRTAHATVVEALRAGEISIHKAWRWSNESPTKQLENLRLRRLERGIKKKARALVVEHQAATLRSVPDPRSFTVRDLVGLVNYLSATSIDESGELGPVVMATLDVSGRGIYVTQELLRAFRHKQKGFVK